MHQNLDLRWNIEPNYIIYDVFSRRSLQVGQFKFYNGIFLTCLQSFDWQIRMNKVYQSLIKYSCQYLREDAPWLWISLKSVVAPVVCH